MKPITPEAQAIIDRLKGGDKLLTHKQDSVRFQNEYLPYLFWEREPSSKPNLDALQELYANRRIQYKYGQDHDSDIYEFSTTELYQMEHANKLAARISPPHGVDIIIPFAINDNWQASCQLDGSVILEYWDVAGEQYRSEHPTPTLHLTIDAEKWKYLRLLNDILMDWYK